MEYLIDAVIRDKQVLGYITKQTHTAFLKLKGKVYNKPYKIEIDEWYYKGCFIQKQEHPKLPKYHVFKDTENQETIDGCYTFQEAKKLCELNEVKNPLNGLKSYIL